MPKTNPPNPVSPELKQLQQPGQNFIRTGLRIAGPVIFLAGLLCAIIAAASLFASAGSFEPPHYFWLGFVGLPLMFVGAVLCQFGFMGAVETVAKAAAKGVVEGMEAGRKSSEEGKD